MTRTSPDPAATPEEPGFDLTAGDLALDFSNTLADRPAGSEEGLTCYADLVGWAREAGILEGERARGLLAAAAGAPEEAWETLQRGVELREALYSAFSARARGAAAADEAVAVLNRSLGEALPHLTLARAGSDLGWSWRGPAEALDQMLWPVARAAAELLTSERAARVRECASDTCGWLFLDRSRGGRRKWCDMKTCGNRQKARRYYHRRKSAGRPSP